MVFRLFDGEQLSTSLISNNIKIILRHFLSIKYSWNFQRSVAYITAQESEFKPSHYSDVIMSTMASQITGVATVCSNVCSGADQRKHQSSASLAFVWGIHQWPVNSPPKGPVARNMFPFDDDIILFLKMRCNDRPCRHKLRWMNSGLNIRFEYFAPSFRQITNNISHKNPHYFVLSFVLYIIIHSDYVKFIHLHSTEFLHLHWAASILFQCHVSTINSWPLRDAVVI